MNSTKFNYKTYMERQNMLRKALESKSYINESVFMRKVFGEPLEEKYANDKIGYYKEVLSQYRIGNISRNSMFKFIKTHSRDDMWALRKAMATRS